MTLSEHLVRAAKVTVVLGVAVLTGVVAMVASALLGHEVLVLTFGENLAPLADTLPMIVAFAFAYLAGIAAWLVAVVGCWRRLVRHSGRVTRPR